MQRTRRWGTAALALALVVAATACGDDDDGAADSAATPTSADEPDGTDAAPTGTEPADGSVAPAELDGREFVSQTVEGHELAAGSEIRVSFDGEEIGVYAGCNNMFGGYTLEEDVLTVEQMAMTEMACEEPLMAQDAWVAQLLAAGVTVTLDGDELVFDGGDAGSITFLDREVAEPDVSIEGTRWVVDGIVSGDAVSSVPQGLEASLTIVDGIAEVETGCNTGSGPVEVGPATLTFGPLAVTLRACDTAAAELEAAVLATLSGEVDYVIQADRLSLDRQTDDGDVGLTLVAS